MYNIRKLEKDLWAAADELRQGSKLTSQQYCMPVLGLIFLRYAFSRFQHVEAEIMKNRPTRGGVPLSVTSTDFNSKSAIFLPKEARFDYLVSLPEGQDIGKAVNKAMSLIEEEKTELAGVLPKTYTDFNNALLGSLLKIFNHSALTEVKDDLMGRIYEYFLNKFAPTAASDDGVFFTPKSLVRMIVNLIEPQGGIIFDPACGSGGMFVSTKDFVEGEGRNVTEATTFYGQEKVEFNAQLCLMNMAVHGLNAKIISGEAANTFYNDAHNLVGKCDYVMANPPFNVDKVKSENVVNGGRLPFGLPGVNNKTKEVSNANYLWISYFYAYLKATGRAGFVMASSATDSANKDRDIREKLVNTGHVDAMVSVGNNFFYTKSLPCSLWFFDKSKKEQIRNKVLFIDVRQYFTVVDRTFNEWSPAQLKNLNAIVWLYRGETAKYKKLLKEYLRNFQAANKEFISVNTELLPILGEEKESLVRLLSEIKEATDSVGTIVDTYALQPKYAAYKEALTQAINALVDTGDGYAKSGKGGRAKADAYAREIFRTDDKKCKWSGAKKVLQNHLAAVTNTEYGKEGVLTILQTIVSDAQWLTDKFGSGVYADVLGLCKVATIEEIKEKNYSLTPGAYVGVAPEVDDGVDFTARMKEIHQELLSLQKESNTLMKTISKNMEEMGL